MNATLISTQLITDENRESVMDRPSETPWTPKERARHAAGRAVTVAMAQARAAKNKIKVTLATETDMVTFERDGDLVLISRVDGPYLDRFTTSLDHGRAEYRRLLKAGYWRW
jgi:hypothetical protein